MRGFDGDWIRVNLGGDGDRLNGLLPPTLVYRAIVEVVM